MKRRITASLGAAAALALVGGAPALAEESTTTLSLRAITDFHGHIERVVDSKTGAVKEPGAITLACEIEKARAADPSLLFVSNGDNVGGSAYISSILNDQPTIDVLNAIGLDVTSAGNHEFDLGITDLAGRLTGAFNAPILSANVTGNPVLDAEGSGGGTWVTEVKGVKVGFVGVVTEELPSLVSKAALEGLSVADEVATANAKAAELKKNGADAVVVLAHEDAEVDGGQFSGDVDAVVGGHTHVPFAQVVKSTSGTDIAVVQPDHYGSLLGEITLDMAKGADGAWTVTARRAVNRDLMASDCTSDAYGVQAIVDKAAADAEAAGGTPIADLASDFLRGANTGSDTGANRSTESTASNLLADSFQNWVANDIVPAGDHYIGLMNPGGVRADFAAGELTEGEGYTVQPFGNEMAYATYTGAQIKQVLAQQFQPTTSRALLHLGVSSNTRVVLDEDAAAELEGYWNDISSGAKTAEELAGAIDDARAKVVKAVHIDDAPLKDSDSVVVASNSFLLAGGDNFTVLAESPMTNTGTLDRTITAQYLKRIEPARASYIKRQILFSSTVSDNAAQVSVAGLVFSPSAEQGVGDAAVKLGASVILPDGSAKPIGAVDVDPTITPGLPETGRAELTLSIPDGAETSACESPEFAGRQCARVLLTAFAASGAEQPLPLGFEVPVRVAAPAPEPEAPQSAPAPAPSQPDPAPAKGAKTGLAATGADSQGLLAGSLALGLAGALGLALSRKRS